MSTVWELAFLNIAIVMFCLKYSWNIPIVVKASFFQNHFFLLKSQYQSLQNDISATFYVTLVTGESHKNNAKISFRVILPVLAETALCLVVMENPK